MTPVRSEQDTESADTESADTESADTESADTKSAGQHRTLRPAFLSVAPSVEDWKGVLSRGFVCSE